MMSELSVASICRRNWTFKIEIDLCISFFLVDIQCQRYQRVCVGEKNGKGSPPTIIFPTETQKVQGRKKLPTKKQSTIVVSHSGQLIFYLNLEKK